MMNTKTKIKAKTNRSFNWSKCITLALNQMHRLCKSVSHQKERWIRNASKNLAQSECRWQKCVCEPGRNGSSVSASPPFPPTNQFFYHQHYHYFSSKSYHYHHLPLSFISPSPQPLPYFFFILNTIMGLLFSSP